MSCTFSQFALWYSQPLKQVNEAAGKLFLSAAEHYLDSKLKHCYALVLLYLSFDSRRFEFCDSFEDLSGLKKSCKEAIINLVLKIQKNHGEYQSSEDSSLSEESDTDEQTLDEYRIIKSRVKKELKKFKKIDSEEFKGVIFFMILYIPKMAFFIDFRTFFALYQGYDEKSYMPEDKFS